MRSVVVALCVLGLIIPLTAYAASTCRDRNEECSLGELLQMDKDAQKMGLSKEEHISILLEIISNLRRIISTFYASSQVSYCVDLEYDLRPGATDAKTNGEVSTLQFFLTSQYVYPEKLVTGEYGPATARAVLRWQLEQGIEKVDETTGVGKITRQKIRENTCAYIE